MLGLEISQKSQCLFVSDLPSMHCFVLRLYTVFLGSYFMKAKGLRLSRPHVLTHLSYRREWLSSRSFCRDAQTWLIGWITMTSWFLALYPSTSIPNSIYLLDSLKIVIKKKNFIEAYKEKQNLFHNATFQKTLHWSFPGKVINTQMKKIKQNRMKC